MNKTYNDNSNHNNKLIMNNSIKSNNLDNQGYSLIELIVSVAILSILLLPILQGFTLSINANVESKKAHLQNMIAQNIMEEMKVKSMEYISTEYNVTGDDSYEVEPNPTGSGYLLYTSNSYSKKAKYYFLKRNINNKYDALITLDATPYIDATIDSDRDFNDSPMPLISEINSSDNLVAMQTFEANLALIELYDNHIDYCNVNSEIPKDSSDILAKLEKLVAIDISQAGSDIEVEIKLIYSSQADYHCGTSEQLLIKRKLTSSDENIYVFYEPSYKDSIKITKSASITDSIDIYLYKQTAFPASSSLVGTVPTGVNLYSNISEYSSNGVKTEVKNRIFDIKVQLFETDTTYNPATSYVPGKRFVEIDSTKGEK